MICGYAAGVWAMFGWIDIRNRHYGMAMLYASMAATTLFSMAVIGSILIDRPIGLPQGSTTLILMPIIAVPPTIQLLSWAKARQVIQVERERP